MRIVSFFLICLSLFFLFFRAPNTLAAQCDDNPPPNLNQEQHAAFWAEVIKDCQQKIISSVNQQQTLKQALITLNSKIKLTQVQIAQTAAQIAVLEKDINTLNVVVTDLDKSLNSLSTVFVARVRESYKHRSPEPFVLFLSSRNFADFFTKIRYLNIVKAKDQIVLNEMQSAKTNFDAQKLAKVLKQQEIEKLKTQLTIQQKSLAAQQKSKQELLVITQNDEKKYQNLLNQARAELEAINAIIAGNGDEKEIGDVNKGDLIARVIQGPSCNSGGAHLHFIVAQGGIVQNPFNHLKSVDYENCSGSSCNSSDGDPFNPSGSWDWPINSPVRMNQGYGYTWAVRNTWVGSIYDFHNGIDINNDNSEVKAVQPGKLFRGSYVGNNGCALKYVHIKHKDSSLETFYLHVNYN